MLLVTAFPLLLSFFPIEPNLVLILADLVAVIVLVLTHQIIVFLVEQALEFLQRN